MTGDFHVGDRVTMFGDHNVGKMVGSPNNPAAPRQGDSNVVWSDPVVFINYRSADEKPAADIEAEITRRLGRGSVFRDVWMPAGIEFPDELLTRASTCRVMLSIIGEKWDDAHGLRLLNNHADWVRREIATALANRAHVVPVLVGARTRLSAKNLPEDIRAIANLQAQHVRRTYDEHDVRRLVADLLRDVPALTMALFRTR
ncbi:toll/interleukin-1 receptor domain-containing protein [Actinophytocola sp.]|uniref:toll/interleukin-1 receptor domain-containing protein n=1 Tax=Actinophytocola sp. TaxID=1872138 RepID=UPI003899BC5F